MTQKEAESATAIRAHIQALDKAYYTLDEGYQSSLFKLAVLEICGWIESEINDKLLSRLDATITREKVPPTSFRKKVKGQFVNQLSGVDYSQKIRLRIAMVLGARETLRIEGLIGRERLQDANSQSEKLRIIRDELAHTSLAPGGHSPKVYAPNRLFEFHRELIEVIHQIAGEIQKV